MTYEISTRKMEANEAGRGNLAGTKISCTCGYSEGTTLSTQVGKIAHDHATYHQRKGQEVAA